MLVLLFHPRSRWLAAAQCTVPCGAEPCLALTFDDGPSADVTPRVLAILREKDVRATFFLVGRQVDRYPALARGVCADGHAIGNHTYSHPSLFCFLTPRRLRDEIGRAQEAIGRVTGVRPACFRSPVGLRHPLLEPALQQASLTFVLWALRTYDTRPLKADALGHRILPVMLFTLGAMFVFVIRHRFWEKSGGKRERNSVIWTDIAIAAAVGWIVIEIGWRAFLLVELPILMIAFGAGVWLFYVQHNFDPSYWERHANWDFFNAGMDGSSFYKLPKLLQWFTGNIGFHHILHLSPKIPNYKLEQCHNENPQFQITPLTIRRSLKSLMYRLWDEKEQMLVGWSALKKYKPQPVMVKS